MSVKGRRKLLLRSHQVEGVQEGSLASVSMIYLDVRYSRFGSGGDKPG